MTTLALVRHFWMATINAAIRIGDEDAAYDLTVGYVRRLRKLGLAL